MSNNGANLGFESKLWEMADKLRGHMDASEYKRVVPGLIFLKYISDAFRHKYDELAATAETEYTDPEDRDEYLADNIFWVPPEARWEQIQAQAPQPVIGCARCSAPRAPRSTRTTGVSTGCLLPRWMGVEMLPMKNKRPRCFHRGQLSTGNPQSFEQSLSLNARDFNCEVGISAFKHKETPRKNRNSII